MFYPLSLSCIDGLSNLSLSCVVGLSSLSISCVSLVSLLSLCLSPVVGLSSFSLMHRCQSSLCQCKQLHQSILSLFFLLCHLSRPGQQLFLWKQKWWKVIFVTTVTRWRNPFVIIGYQDLPILTWGNMDHWQAWILKCQWAGNARYLEVDDYK